MARRPKITPAHRRVFLDELRAGRTRGVAARAAHKDLTGTAFRAIMHRDRAFAAKVAEAEAEGVQARVERIDGEFERRAFDETKPSLRALEILAATHHPDYLWLRRRGSTGTDGSQNGLQLLIDPELLTRAQLEELVHLIEMGQGKLPNPELDAERRGLPQGDFIDGEATEEAA